MLMLVCTRRDAYDTHCEVADDLIEYRLSLLKDLVVPAAQDEKSSRFDQAVTLLVVVSLFLMLPTIELYDDVCLKACKVGDKTRDMHLPSKPATSDLPMMKVTPQ